MFHGSKFRLDDFVGEKHQLSGSNIFDRIGYGFEDNKLLQRVLAALNRLPLPFHLMPVKVGDHILYAHRFDRYLALLRQRTVLGSVEVQLLEELCFSGMTVIDVGANIGLYTVELAKLVGATGRVIAYEPDCSNFDTLCKNITANHYLFVTPINAAVGNQSGTVGLYKSESNSGGHRIISASTVWDRQQVPMVSLDESLSEETAVHLIKIDVQGAEGLVLQGMRRILTTNPGLCVIFEFWPFGLNQFGFKPDEVLADLMVLGYKIVEINQRPNIESQINDPKLLLNTLGPGQYINLLARASTPR